MRSMAAVLFPALLAIVAACGSAPVTAGWRGADIHLVDGVWIGTEVDCTKIVRLVQARETTALECRTIIDRAMAALEPSVPNSITGIVLATLPGTYVTADGKEITPRIAGGIMTRKAVVIDRVDGSRHVIGLWCHLPSDHNGRLHVSAVTCDIAPLEDWQDGTVPPSL